MIKSTVNPSSESPIVAVCSQKAAIDDATGTLFAGILCKPIVSCLSAPRRAHVRTKD